MENEEKEYIELEWSDIKKIIAEKFNTDPSSVKFWYDCNGALQCKVFSVEK